MGGESELLSPSCAKEGGRQGGLARATRADAPGVGQAEGQGGTQGVQRDERRGVPELGGPPRSGGKQREMELL